MTRAKRDLSDLVEPFVVTNFEVINSFQDLHGRFFAGPEHFVLEADARARFAELVDAGMTTMDTVRRRAVLLTKVTPIGREQLDAWITNYEHRTVDADVQPALQDQHAASFVKDLMNKIGKEIA